MRPSTLLTAIALLHFGTVAAADEATHSNPQASATLPLDRLLELHGQAQAEKPKVERPPVAAGVSEAVLTGRLLERALDITAQFKVSVLAEGWVRIPLMQLDPSMHVQSLEKPENGTVLTEGDMLVLVTKTPGQHVVQVSALKTARMNGSRRRAEVALPKAAVSVMRVRFDSSSLRLASAWSGQTGEEYVFYPEKGRFLLEWEAQGQPVRVAAKRVPVEPVIGSARASVVCTLDGVQITKALYELRLQGAQPLSFAIPQGNTLTRVLLNGTPVPFTVKDGSVRLTAEPNRTGDESARVVLVLQGARREFHLSGRLGFAFPAASWNTHLLQVALHLPAVFDYTWTGGSLAPLDPDDEEEIEGDESLPMPGKVFHFQQELISSSPDVIMDYAVNLEGRYFGG